MINEFWTFYENLNEIVYVSDVDTYELIYMNRHAREVYNISSMDEVKGQKCHEVLQGCSSPCAMCTNRYLKENEFHEWSYYNPILRKSYSLKDTLFVHNGRNLRFELSLDISLQETQKQTIEEFVAHESMINNGLKQALSALTPDMSLNVLMEYLGKSLHSDRVYIFEENEEHSFDNTYEWCAAKVIPQIGNLQKVPYEAVAIWYDSFHHNQNVLIKDIELIREENPAAYDYLLPQQIRSLVVSPLISDQKIIGFYGVDNPPQEFLNHISTMFQVLGHFITSMIRRRELVTRLENLSYFDQLTGVKNRHGMNEFIANVPFHKSIGIVYCDVMGLKKINDTLGHLEGDALLVRSAECLRHVFPAPSVFRIGGDEFLIMQSGITESELNSQIEQLRISMPDYNTTLAIGHTWSSRCSGQIASLICSADQLMYNDKRKHYEQEAFNRRSPRSFQ